MNHSERWDAEENLGSTLCGNLTPYTALEVLYVIRNHLMTSKKYSKVDRENLLRCSLRDIDKIAGK